MLEEEIPNALSQFVPSFLHSNSSGHRESAVNKTEIDPVLLELPFYRALYRHAKIKIGFCDATRSDDSAALPWFSTQCACAQAWPNRIQPKAVSRAGLVPQLGKQKGAGLCPETCGCRLTEVSWRLGKVVVAGSLGEKRYRVMAAKAKAEEVGRPACREPRGITWAVREEAEPAPPPACPPQVPVDGAEKQQRPAAAEELVAQKREQRLRKFRDLHLKRECTARGEDYKKVKLLEISAEDAEKWERKKEEKPQSGIFSGELFYPTSNSLLHGTHVPSTEEIVRMVVDLEKQIEKRDKYSRRRPYNDDADIDYINERNAKFNKKAERFYGKYTAEIKQNLERGTAV
ncbi:uncharacterized protein [Physeter macrocephalus]|uniref:Pre-mRNA-splicing factor SYF2 n=1 Tax=Physeter macrocephalus TaxID=9755 RepID=A0A455B4I8_PHYMC|nr:uncharacterized protein LOC102990730 [Physeter catodon]|eukprot:XP_028343850.1 uncharacterized protein LOC102990730 [Physeter catodon]